MSILPPCSNAAKVVPLGEWTEQISKQKLSERCQRSTKRSKGKHKDVEISVQIEPDLTDTYPYPDHARKGRATVQIKVQREPGYSYKASASVAIFDPEDEVILTEKPQESIKFPVGEPMVPFRKDTATFDLELGNGLHKKIEKSTSEELELQVRVTLHLEPCSTSKMPHDDDIERT